MAAGGRFCASPACDHELKGKQERYCSYACRNAGYVASGREGFTEAMEAELLIDARAGNIAAWIEFEASLEKEQEETDARNHDQS